MRRTRSPEPVLITTAPESNEDEYDRRRKKYAFMMSLRAACVIAAACVYRVSLWLAVGLMVGGVVLPWCAVIIANDRPARKRAVSPGYRPAAGTERALTAGDDGRTVDG